MERWEGRVVMITGAASGMGAATATALINKGVIVVGLDRDKNKLQQLENTLRDRKNNFHPMQVELKEESQILDAFAWTEKNLGPIHCFINNAGILPQGKNLIEADTKSLKDILEINVLAVQICSREAVKSMVKHRVSEGIIINLSSIAASLSSQRPGYAAYAASKRAVLAVSEGLRIELALAKSNIKVTTILPGIVNTSLFENGGFQIPDRPSLEPEHVAETICSILALPAAVQISEISVRPIGEDLTRP